MKLGSFGWTAVLVALFAFGATPVFAQLQSGRIVGTVYDPQRAGIPGATVTPPTSPPASPERSSPIQKALRRHTDRPGVYSVSAEVPGFQKTA
jgi:hypothetical protein